MEEKVEENKIEGEDERTFCLGAWLQALQWFPGKQPRHQRSALWRLGIDFHLFMRPLDSTPSNI
jgi:hypothetical protein